MSILISVLYYHFYVATIHYFKYEESLIKKEPVFHSLFLRKVCIALIFYFCYCIRRCYQKR